ncbi:hypothetical protein QYE76_070071 [Lolium multiflorum]|uniref:MULE transposase domain-containing protein n=1 Tax=Lolium multiflorum TaxID=4521 RepID=A0AAD8SHJ7_LOLMU|nr:hypothetical protein QYE76_070071 [Lolium multiflorum]
MSITLGAATKLLDDMMINYSEWHTERAPQGKKVNSVEETSSLSDKIDVIMSMLVNGRSNVDPNNVPLASLVAQEENVDVNFIKNNNFNNNAYRNNSGNNYRPYPSANGNGYGNSYGNSYNNNRSVPSGLEAMLKEFISTQTAFNKSVEEKLDKIDTIASRVDRLASDVNLLKLKVMPNNDIDNKITTTANAIQVRINENIRLMAELRARWDREENEKLAKENNVAKVWTITTTSNANSSHVAAPPTINGKIIGVGNVSTPSAKRTKLPEIAKTAETACDKTAEIFSNLGDNDPIAVAHNDLDFDDCHISEVIKFLQKLAKSPNASAINLAFTKHITNALIKAREEKLKLETSIPRKLEDGWEPIIKMKFNDFECNALCDLGASISVMPKKIYDMLDLPPLKNCYLDVNLADNVKKKPLGRIDNVHITVNNNLVPVDFVVLDIECNASCPIVLGRPFLRTVGAVIDMREGSALAPESLVLRRITFRDHQPSTCFLAPTGSIKPWFLSEGKLATVRIIPSSWGSQRTSTAAPSVPSASGSQIVPVVNVEDDAEIGDQSPEDDEDELMFPELVDRCSKQAMEDQYMEDIAFGARFDETDDEEKNENDDSLVLADYEGEDLPTIEWNREDPQLAKGTVFQTMMDCRNAITTYHILTKNNYEIKNNKEIHRCPPLGGEPDLKTKLAKTRWLADIILDWLRETPSLGPTALQKKVAEKYKGMKVPYMRMFYAKEMALDKINGPWNESFQLLYTFKAEVEMASPGSVVAIDKHTVPYKLKSGKVMHKECFRRAFVCFKACWKGFLDGCRPYLAVDASALHGRFKGQLVAATAVDGHNWMFPVAYGVLEVESEESWTWFLQNLRDLIGHPPGLVIHTDACKAVTRCSGGDGDVDGGDNDDDDGDDVPLDDDGDGVDFPLREGISDSCPPESSFLSGVLRPAEAVTLREVLSVA